MTKTSSVPVVLHVTVLAGEWVKGFHRLISGSLAALEGLGTEWSLVDICE